MDLNTTKWLRSLMITALLLIGLSSQAQPYCNQAQDGPGFPSYPLCEIAVCALDDFCCETEWDGLCAGQASQLPVCNECGIFCNEAQPGVGFGSDPGCESAVCAEDAFCCDSGWDAICAETAASLPACDGCSGIEGCNDPAASNYVEGVIFETGCEFVFCDEAQLTAGFSNDPGCEAAVCAGDPFCCDTEWDSVCASDASTNPSCAGCLTPVPGCNDPLATNFNPDATVNDGSCNYDQYLCCEFLGSGVVCPFTDCANDVCIVDPFCCNTNWDGVCAGQAIITPSCNCDPGCTNPLANNFDPSAVYDDGSCDFDQYLCCEAIDSGLPCPFSDCEADVCAIDSFCCDNSWDSVCASQAIITPSCNCDPGCTNPLANNFDPSAVYDDGTCEFDQYLCCEAIDSGLPCPFSDCEADVCAIDSFCCDNSWDSVCASEAIVTPSCNCDPGCTNPLAENFDPSAVYDDGTCEFAPDVCCVELGGLFCPITACADAVCAEDPFCCDTEWDGVCATAAADIAECSCGPITSVEEVGTAALSVLVFPNPNTGDFVNVSVEGLTEMNHDVVIRVFSLSGKMVAENAFGHTGSSLQRTITFNGAIAPGMYLVDIYVDGNQTGIEKLVVK